MLPRFLSLLIITSSSLMTMNCDRSYRFAAGFDGGTYHKIGQSLNELGSHHFKVVTTQGSRDNIARVSKGKADLAIAQLDAWNIMVHEDEKLGRAVKLLFPMYSEEVHILARKGLNSLRSLKSMSVGPKKSGMSVTASILLGALGMTNIKLENGATAKAIKRLVAGEVDAVMIVAGAPVEILSKLDEAVRAKTQLIALNAKELEQLTDGPILYREIALNKKQYPWLKGEVKGVAVDSIFIGRATLTSKQVNELLEDVFTSQAILAEQHVKWQQLDIMKTKRLLARNKEAFHPAIAKEFGGPRYKKEWARP